MDSPRWTRTEAVAVVVGLGSILGAALSIAIATGPSVDRLGGHDPIAYFIDPITTRAGFRATDVDLAEWALRAWERELVGKISFESTPDPTIARIRMGWAASLMGRFGEMQPMLVHGRRGAAIRVRSPDHHIAHFFGRHHARDPLFRDVVIYLSCLHELGHALGLSHSERFGDVMFDFQTRERATEFFQQHRDALSTRDEIRQQAGLSPNDIHRVRTLYR